MFKLNRIGNKLGAVGLFGVLLAGGMLVNQMLSETAINTFNQRAEGQQVIATHALEADVGLRRMQLAVRDVRLATTPANADNATQSLAEATAWSMKELDVAIGKALKPENKERLQKIKSLAEQYNKGALEIKEVQLKIFGFVTKRNELSAEWTKAFSTALASPALLQASNRTEIEKGLYQADAAFNGVRASTWRLAASGDESQKQAIEKRGAEMTAALTQLRNVASAKEFGAMVDSFAGFGKTFMELTDDSIKLEAVKKDLVENKTLPVSGQALVLMRAAVDTAEKLSGEAQEVAAAELSRANRISFIAAVVIMLSLVGSVIFTFIGVASPLTRLNGALAKMAAGELNIEIPGSTRGDEVGDMAKTVVVIRENAEQKARDEATAKIMQDELMAKQRKADMIKLADSFESAVGEIIQTVSSASTELEASATTLTATAERSQELAISVAAASEEASTNVQSVASATEELSSSVNEISRQVQESARMASEAVGQARATNDRVSELSKAAARIGDVVELINTIAGQTNLLALNATIEAARAGEAGRGFAVVASEVKALAEQTAKATGEIGHQISSIQGATQESVTAIKEISGTIERLSEISSTIAAAVEEQGAATQEISRNVQQAAMGTQQVSSNITDVQRGASETGTASSQVLSAAQMLSSDSNRLKLEVGKFLATVRTA